MFEDIFNIALNFTYNQQVYEMVIILVSKQGSFEGRDEGESKVKKIIREFFFDSQENLLKQLKKKEFKPDICKMKDQRPWLYTDPWVSSDWTMLKSQYTRCLYWQMCLVEKTPKSLQLPYKSIK